MNIGVLFAVLCNSVLLGEEAKPYKYPEEHVLCELLSRDLVYQGKPPKENKQPGIPIRPSILDDTGFAERLGKENLVLSDAIDDRETGLQAIVVSHRGSGQVYLAFRGTEILSAHSLSAMCLDLWDDVKKVKRWVGHRQYQSNFPVLHGWAKQWEADKTKVVVVGHSLGAALAQRFIADHPLCVKEAVLFCSPAIEKDVLDSMQKRHPEGLSNVTHYMHKADPVSNLAGDVHVPGRIVVVSKGIGDSGLPWRLSLVMLAVKNQYPEHGKLLNELGDKIANSVDAHCGIMLKRGVKLQEIALEQYAEHRATQKKETHALIEKNPWLASVYHIMKGILPVSQLLLGRAKGQEQWWEARESLLQAEAALKAGRVEQARDIILKTLSPMIRQHGVDNKDVSALGRAPLKAMIDRVIVADKLSAEDVNLLKNVLQDRPDHPLP